MEKEKPTFAFFGTPDIAVFALEELRSFGYTPSLIVTNPDAPVGRKQTLTPPPAKSWGLEHGIEVLQPATLRERDQLTKLTDHAWDFFVVVAYGKIIPEWLINLPRYKTINAHPSLLPKLRGASPIRSALLTDLSAVGVTIIALDNKLDHGPILAQLPVELKETIPGRKLDEALARICGDLLADVMEKIMKGEVSPIPQDEASVTYCEKITKDMGELSIDPFNLPQGAEATDALRKIHAFDGWPGTFFFHDGKRIKIIEASLTESKLNIERVVPEGKKEMDFSVFLQTLQS
jgi:methionyl-tRNA formyltransferase